MDEVVIEYRGIAGQLAVGESLIVESCEAGVLRLRRAPADRAPELLVGERGPEVTALVPATSGIPPDPSE